MRNKEIIGNYYPSSSFMHRINSLCKIIGFVLYISLFLWTKNYLAGFLLVGFTFLLIFLSKVPLKLYMHTIWQMKYLILSLFLLGWLLSYSLYDILYLITWIIGVMFYSFFLSSTTKIEDLTEGIELFLSPLKLFGIKVNRISFTITLAIMFIPMILEEGQFILKSLATRGMDYQNSTWKEKIYILKAMLIPLFSKTIKAADDFSNTLHVRFYQVDKTKPFYLDEKLFSKLDAIYIMTHILLFFVVVEVF